MIEIEEKSITYSVKITDENFWYRLTDGDVHNRERTGTCWWHWTISRHKLNAYLKNFSETDQAALLALEADYYHFHWFDQKKEDRYKKTAEKRFKKSQERFHGR
jgi:hypothetical protein